MCSINISLKNPDLIEAMNEKTKHRGIYSSVMEYRGMGLGHIRLPIQGLDSKFQCPFKIKDFLYLFNGEIFNYKELKPSAESDVEILDSDPTQFDGDFAIVKITPEMLEITTDQYGKRQLYYRIENGRISRISSEIKALMGENDQIDEIYLQTVARFGYYFGGERTICRNVKRFLPGLRYYIPIEEKIIHYIEKIKWEKSSFDYKRQNIKDQIEKSIKRRLISDVPVSLLYSGGLDSSIILYHLKKLNSNIEVFTSPNEDDLQYARKYAKELGIKLNFVSPVIHGDSHLRTESVADLGSVDLNYGLFKAVRDKGYKVCLTGDGADEVFSGYKRNQVMDFQRNDIFNELMYYHLPRLDRSAMAHTVEYRSPFTADHVVGAGLRIPYEERINKKILRESYKHLIPNYILNRPKVPLKSKEIKENKEENRIKLVKKWSNELFEKLKTI